MKDERTLLERIAWNTVGPPLYYCEECLRMVKVTSDGGEVTIKRHCNHDTARIIAPRKAITSGKGYAGLSIMNKAKVKASQLASSVTGRCV